jgi:hypothetical protein
MQTADARTVLTRLVNGYRQSQCIGVAAQLQLAERLAAGPRSAADLAAECGAHEPSLRRLLRALVAMQVMTEDPTERFGLTALGEQLGADLVGPAARLFNSPHYWAAWANLEHSIRTGERAFDFTFGMHNWDYYATHPEEGALFDKVMSANTLPVAGRIANAFDFSRFPFITDVGGGDGTLLMAIVQRHPSVRGIVFDRPDVIERARKRIAEAGMTDRCEVASGNFMDQVPEGAAAYVMKWIIHDWSDSESIRILERCRAAGAATGAHVIVIDRVLPERIGPDDLDDLLADLNMMVMPGGRERTETEFRALFQQAGFSLERVVPTGTHLKVLEAVPR